MWRSKGAHGEPEAGSVSMIHSPCDDMRSMGAADLRAVGLRTQAVTVCQGGGGGPGAEDQDSFEAKRLQS